MAEATTPKRRRWVRVLRRLAVLAVVVVIMMMGLVWWMQRYMLFAGAYVPHNVSLSLPEEATLWTRDTGDGVVEAWLLPGDGATAENPGPAVVFCHGNGELINIWTHEMRWYTSRGYTVLLPEYRGYGRSEGTPSQANVLEDLTDFTDRLAALPSVDAGRIVYHGRSLGGAVAVQLATVRPPRAMVLASTFTSVRDVAGHLFGVRPPGFLVRDRFPVEALLPKYDGPVLILHGELDRVVPVEHARRNAAAARDARLVVYPGIDHNDMPGGHGKWADILGFLAEEGLPWDVVPEVQGRGLP